MRENRARDNLWMLKYIRILTTSIIFLLVAILSLLEPRVGQASSYSLAALPSLQKQMPLQKPMFTSGVLLSKNLNQTSSLVNTARHPSQTLDMVQSEINQTILNLPLQFISNVGQADPTAKFISMIAGSTIFFANDGVFFSSRYRTEGALGLEGNAIVHQHFPGADPQSVVEGVHLIQGRSNFIMGNDPTKWNTDIPAYSVVVYRNLYPGIDLTYSGEHGQLKSQFVVTPGANPQSIQIGYSGTSEIYIRGDGALVLKTLSGELVDQKPVGYQNIAGEFVPVNVNFRLANSALASLAVAFDVSAYNPDYPLVIDPVWTFSTYLGGGGDDYGIGIAVDKTGNIYVTGYTNSSNFPTISAISNTLSGGYDIFVTKIITASGVYTYGYSTYLGGNSDDYALKIAVDDTGNSYLTGYTSSSNFPTVNAISTTLAGSTDAFVAKLNSTGTALLYSTYLGGNSDDYGQSIAVDNFGDAYVVGFTNSSNFPTIGQIQGYQAGTNAFVVKINSSGTLLLFSSYLGGSGNDYGTDIALDKDSNIYMTGYTSSSNFPTVQAIASTYRGGVYDAFVTKLITASGVYTYAYSTYLGGSDLDQGNAIVVDSIGNVYVTGQTYSSDFPTVNALQSVYGGNGDIFVTKLNAAGSAYVYSTYFGTSLQEAGKSIAVDSTGNAYVTGPTNASASTCGSDPFPPCSDVFVRKLNPDGSGSAYISLGGMLRDFGIDIAVDTTGSAYVTGWTQSTDFPAINALQSNLGGPLFTKDAFIARVDGLAVVVNHDVKLAPSSASWSDNPGATITYTLTLTNNGNVTDNYLVTFGSNVFTTTVTPTTISSLGAGASRNVTGTVQIPNRDFGGVKDTAIVTATSQGDLTKFASSVLTTTVNCNQGARNAPTSATNNLENYAVDWGVYCEGAPTWSKANVATPSLDGSSLRLSLTGGDPYSNAHFYRTLTIEPDAGVFTLTVPFYISQTITCNNQPSPSSIQAIEFTMNKWYQSKRYEFALQWQNVGAGAPQWRYWDPNEIPANRWIAINPPVSQCLTGQQWHVLTLRGEIINNQVHYNYFTIDGQTNILNITVAPISTPGEPDRMVVAIQLDGNSSETPYDVLIDQVGFARATWRKLFLPLIEK